MINTTMNKSLTLGDYLVIGPFAWIISQSVIRMDMFWFFIGIWMFNIYANKRSGWDE